MDPPHVQSTLPFDIFSEVIGHLDVEKDIPTLRSLSTTCATLLEPSQRMIFSTISIKMVSPAPDGLRPEYLALKDLLITSPHLATYVSHLKLSFAIPHSDTLIVTSVVERLVALKSLHLQNMANDGSYPEQNSEWRAFIGQVLQQPSLLRLKVDGSGQLPCSIWYLPALMSIELGKWRIKEADPLATPYPTLSRRLAINWVDFSQIETLERFLRASPRLRELDLHLPASTPHQYVGLSAALINVPTAVLSLQSLSFLVVYDVTDLNNPFAGLARELEQLSNCEQNVIQTIQFSILCLPSVNTAHLPTLFETFDSGVHWAGFQHLRRLGIKLYMWYSRSPGSPGLPDKDQVVASVEGISTAIRDKFSQARNQVVVEFGLIDY